MSKNKRYFWLKLKDDFFNQKEIKMLRRIAGGDTYTIIYLKMLLLSLKNEGRIYYDGIASNMVDEIALEIDEETENTQIAFSYMQQKGLVEFDQADEITMTNIASMIGSETEAAVRKRRQRKRELENVRDNVTPVSQLSHTEIEIEKEIDIELEKEIEQDKDIFQSSLSDVINFYQNNFGIMSPIIQDDLIHWSNDLSPDLVVEAMKKAAFNQKPYSYAKGILSNWLKTNIKTIEQVKQSELQFELNKQQKTQSPYKRSQKIENVPEHMKKPYVEKELSAEEKERLAREEERIRNKLKNLSESEEVSE